MIKKITPNQAAEVMGCSPQFIRIGMQRNLLDICDWLDIDYEEIKDKLPAKEEDDTKKAQDLLKEVNVETGGEE